jgi:high-affinity Fe2+/Pb2+ permease
MIIIFMAGNASDGGALQAYYAANDSLNVIIIPSVILTLVTGLLLCWLTTWGFFKNGWVVYSLVATIVALLMGAVLISPGEGDLLNISKTEGLAALQNPQYTSTWNKVIALHIVEIVILISAIFVSALKPWRKRELAEATS